MLALASLSTRGTAIIPTYPLRHARLKAYTQSPIRINPFTKHSKTPATTRDKLREAGQSEAALRPTTVETIPQASSKRNVQEQNALQAPGTRIQEQNTQEQNICQADRTGTRTPGTRTHDTGTKIQEQGSRNKTPVKQSAL
jgi:hypothetical protein